MTLESLFNSGPVFQTSDSRENTKCLRHTKIPASRKSGGCGSGTSSLGGEFLPQEFLGICYFGIPFRKLFGRQEIHQTLAKGCTIVFDLLDQILLRCVRILLPVLLHLL